MVSIRPSFFSNRFSPQDGKMAVLLQIRPLLALILAGRSLNSVS